jgi:hypothetical protein
MDYVPFSRADARPEDTSIQNFAAVLKQRIAALLIGQVTLAGRYVDPTRVVPLTPDDSPRINVFIDNRNYKWAGDAPPTYDATGKVTVDGYVTGAVHYQVETQGEMLGEQMLALMNNAGFLTAPVRRVASIDYNFEMRGDGDRFEAFATLVFDIEWTEMFEPVIATLTGAPPAGDPGTLPAALGAPFQEIDLTVLSPTGTTLTGATIALSTSLETE